MKKLIKRGAILACVSLVLGLVFFSPTISAKTKYKTQAFDKKMESRQDFAGGNFRNVKLAEEQEGVELSLETGGVGEYVTPTVEAPFGATHIGLHWKDAIDQDGQLRVFVRTSDDGEDFGEWVETAVMEEEGRDGMKKEEKFASLVGVAGAKFAQAKIVFEDQEGRSQKLKQLTFTFIDASTEVEEKEKKLTFAPRITAEGLGFVKTSPHGQQVSVISREEWGADESLRQNVSGGEDWPRSYHGTRKIIVHHTAGASSNGETDFEANKVTVNAIYYYHAVTRGWGDIGYNALVDAAGNVYEGRYGTPGVDFNRTDPTVDEVMTLDVEAAHAASYNAGSFGVSAMGDFTSFELPEAQRAGLKSVLAFVADSRGIDIQDNSDFLRYDGVWHGGLNNVIAHRDAAVEPTACPGDLLYAEMTSIKSETDNLPGMPSNIHGFSAMIDGSDISGKTIGSGMINFNWDDFAGAVGYRYAMERVFGTIYDPQPWESAWMNENNSQTVTNSEITIDASSLDPLAQYVFYVSAVDASGVANSTVFHVNFKTNELAFVDVISPEVWITNPVEGYEAAEKEVLTVSAQASDNVAVTKMEIFFDGKLKATCDNATSCNVNILMRKESFGEHVVESRAFDAAGNSATATVKFTKGPATSDDPVDPPEEPTPTKCSPWPACRER